MMGAVDDVEQQQRELATEDVLQAMGLHPASELAPGMRVWTGPDVDPDVIRFVSPEMVEVARAKLLPDPVKLRVRFVA